MLHYFLASWPLEVKAVDFTVLEPASYGRENVHVFLDMFTKFTQAYLYKDQKAVLKYRVPERLHMNQSGKWSCSRTVYGAISWKDTTEPFLN